MPNFNAISKNNLFLFYSFAFLSLFVILTGFYIDSMALLVMPFGVFIVLWGVLNFKSLYFFLLALIPLSIEFGVTSSLATDLPTEPLMIGFLLLGGIYLIFQAKRLDFSFFFNPIMVLLLIHILWLVAASIFSTVPIFSIKFILAKIWYISAFLIITAIVIKDMKDVKTAFWCVFIPLIFTVYIALFRHALTGFDFDAINPVIRPFYRNHVNYAAILAVFLPFVVFARTWYAKGSFKYNFLVFHVLVLLIAIYFSYTRACYLAVFACLGAFFIFRYKLTKMAVVASLILAIFIGYYTTNQNHYLTYTPSSNTVSQHDLGDLVDATFKAEDVSSMERIYRWIAAIHMINDKPLVGFGPNSFVENYENYTVYNFETWISGNEERSGVHNYFLMTTVEQGLIGLVVFLSLIIAIFVWGEKLFHRLKGQEKLLAQAVLLSMMALLVNLMFSDMIEVDKTGSFFFFNIALLVLLSRNFKGILSSEPKKEE